MKYCKAVECDYCGNIQLTSLKRTFKSFLKNIKWFQTINENGTTSEFCSKECIDNYKQDISNENKS